MTLQTAFDFASPAPRARRRDPETSHDAAREATALAKDHCTRIATVITAAGARGACARELARRTGLTVVQIDRRLHEIDGIERRVREGATKANQFQRREGCAIWWKT